MIKMINYKLIYMIFFTVIILINTNNEMKKVYELFNYELL
jgi:hypothetical protein